MSIKNAYVALEAQRWWNDNRNNNFFATITGNGSPNIPDFWGGIIRADNSTFYNNRKSGEIGAYPLNNLSRFSFCTFTSPNPVTGNNGFEGINVWNTDGVVFQDNTFDMVPARGITALNAGITVHGCTFKNNYQGIKAGSVIDPTGGTFIGSGAEAQRNTFQNNTFGIWSDGITKLWVSKNTFDENDSDGIRISGNSQCRIYNNEFMSNPDGIELQNTGIGEQILDCNTYSQDNFGIRVRGNCHGMEFKNNEFDNQQADVFIQRHIQISSGAVTITPGEILPNQGLNNTARFNYFSENEAQNDIRTLNAPSTNPSTPSPTVFFRYYPPAAEVPGATLARLIPDCDIDDPCVLRNNYHNEPQSFGVQDCDPATFADDEACADRDCLDSLKTRLDWLNQQIALGQTQHQDDQWLTERRFYTDKRILVGQWYDEGNMALIEDVLDDYGQTDDHVLLYGVYARRGLLNQAATVLASLPEGNLQEIWYKSVQATYLQFLAAPGQFQPSHAQDSLLELAGATIFPVGANARTLYYLLHGVWLEPEIEEESEERQATTETFSVAANLMLLPNPADETVQVLLPGDHSDGFIRVVDMLGKTVQELQITGPQMRLPTASLPPGIYIVQHLSPDGKLLAANKLTIQH